MLIGLMSDSHDNIPKIIDAVNFFNSEKVEKVLHAGDICSPFIASKAIVNLKCPFHGIFGNNDGDYVFLLKQFSKIKAELYGQTLKTSIEGKNIFMIHHLEEPVIESIAKGKVFDVIIRGHTHQPIIKNINGTLVINPGETCGYLTDKSTIAILDTAKMEAKLIEI
ncbi:MAG: metallophosphoesterase [Candidatus Lokiarchaeota archaeon]|nr:metallophosphoesterase [Candidatus Lokiarchaeota archaeon]